jgi:hypothetical protein
MFSSAAHIVGNAGTYKGCFYDQARPDSVCSNAGNGGQCRAMRNIAGNAGKMGDAGDAGIVQQGS